MFDMICDIKFNHIMFIDKKNEFSKCTLIIKLHIYIYISMSKKLIKTHKSVRKKILEMKLKE